MNTHSATYKTFIQEISRFISIERIYTDLLRRMAWGTDAGFYRLLPQVVVRPQNEQEVSLLLATAHRLNIPVTFRAAGTSLSGQAVSDSVLIVAGKHWEKYEIADDALTIRLQPGIVGERVNQLLKPYSRKFAPDPASVKSAMVGGIVMNNASGMNCGTHANSDKVLISARIILADGTLLDTASTESRKSFLHQRPDFIPRIEALRDNVQSNNLLMDRIRHKYAIKNVTGLNILPLATFDDPFEIIAHLMVGSEGTLAFLSEVTMHTEYDYPYRASAMLYFQDIKEACRAVVAMKKLQNNDNEWIVKGAELLDKKSLASVSDKTGEGLTAVLTETKARSVEELEDYIAKITQTLKSFDTFIPVRFSQDSDEVTRYWAIRSGIFPSVGGTRPLGTTCLIEDVAFHIEDLPEATEGLQQLIAEHGYDDACIYGHALEGNYHFIINQSFDTPSEVTRYEKLMNAVKDFVVNKYDGSLKAEHGTGRNMAPFVRDEWGDEAFTIMRAVKELFDPKNVLNPGVIFNDDPCCHIKNFKPLPLTDERIDRCIECGFCEANCLTCGLTLSSRQRIVIQREITRLRRSGENPKQLRELEKQFRYAGEQSCAGDGLCATSCPMHINTGELTHVLREANLPAGSTGYRVGSFTAHHFEGMKNFVRPVLTLADTAHVVFGDRAMKSIAGGMHNFLRLPLWTLAMPRAFRFKKEASNNSQSLKVVYFPSCINQTMGLERHSPEQEPLVNKMLSLLQKAGYEVIFPKNMEKLCCGTIWESKGMPEIADKKTEELKQALWEASEQGHWPILCDQSPCLYRMREKIDKMKLYEPVEFIYTFLRERLQFTPTNEEIAVHITCSMRKMGLESLIVELAKLCSTRVFVPEEVGCCGFAGDKGFSHPEVNAYALRKLRPQIESRGICRGYSNSRTCEVGLTTHAGIPYASIAYLIDAHTVAISKTTLATL